MDILPLHIEYLLSRHDCVILPGIGAFIVSEKEAYIDFECRVIRPRRREISFNGSVLTDDGLLTHSIARREGISYEDARRILSRLIDRMTTDLAEEGEVSLGMVGRLISDEEGLISFQPRRSGAISDILPELKLEVFREQEVVTQHDDPAAQTAEDDTDLDGMRTIRVKADRYVFTVSKRAVHAAAMIVAILTVGLSLLIPINHDNEQKASVISIEEFFRRPAIKADKASMIGVNVPVEDNDSNALHAAETTLEDGRSL